MENTKSNLAKMLESCRVAPIVQNVYLTVTGSETTVKLIIPVANPSTCSLESFRAAIQKKLRNISLFNFTTPSGLAILKTQECSTMVTEITKSVQVEHHTFGTRVCQWHVKMIPSRSNRKRRRSVTLARSILKRLRMFAPQHTVTKRMARVVQKLTQISKSL